MDTHQRASKPKRAKVYDDEGMVLPMLLAKYAPHKDTLHHAFYKVAPKEKDLDLRLHKRLIASLKGIAKVDPKEMEPWLQGPGKNTSHHGGLVPWAHKALGIIKPRGPGSRRPADLNLGKGRRPYMIQPYSKHIQQRLAKVRLGVRGFKRLRAKRPARQPMPKTHNPKQ